MKVAHFFLEESKLLLSKAIFFSISMVRMADRVYTLHHHHHLLAFFTAAFYRIQQVVRRGDLKKPPGLYREATSTTQCYKK